MLVSPAAPSRLASGFSSLAAPRKAARSLGSIEQVCAAPLLDNASAGHQKRLVGGRQRPRRVLFHQQDGDAGTRQLMNDAKNFVGNQRRQTEAGFVQQQQARPGHQRTAHGQHLLLAAGQGPGSLVFAFGQAAEAIKDIAACAGDSPFVRFSERPPPAPGFPPRSDARKPPGPRGSGPGRYAPSAPAIAGDGPIQQHVSPPEGFISPMMHFSKVVLPAPLAPTRATVSPGSTVRSTPEQGLGGPVVGGQSFDGQHMGAVMGQAVASMRPR
jgi:hypothetical protein